MNAGESGTPSRRTVLVGIGLGALAIAGAGSALSVQWATRMNSKSNGWWDAIYPSLRNGGISEWSQLVGQWFYFIGGAGGFASYMVREVNPLPSIGERPAEVSRKQAFAVTFHTGAISRATPGDRMIELTHDKYAALPIFVSPAIPNGDKSMITAVFN